MPCSAMIDDPTARPDPRTPPDETAGPGVLPDAECLIGTSLDHARRATDHHHLDPVRAAGRTGCTLAFDLSPPRRAKRPLPALRQPQDAAPVSYTHLRAHE